MKPNFVSHFDVFQSTEKTVPMPCNTEITLCFQMGGANNPANTTVEVELIRTVINGYFYVNFINRQEGKRGSCLDLEAFLVLPDSFICP